MPSKEHTQTPDDVSQQKFLSPMKEAGYARVFPDRGYHKVAVTEFIVTIITLVLITVVVSFIINSDYVSAFSNKSFLFLGVAMVGLSKIALCLRHEFDYRAAFAMLACLLVAGFFITDSDVSVARGGAIALGLIFLVDLIYTIIVKMSSHKSMNLLPLVANISGDLILVCLLIYSSTQTN